MTSHTHPDSIASQPLERLTGLLELADAVEQRRRARQRRLEVALRGGVTTEAIYGRGEDDAQ